MDGKRVCAMRYSYMIVCNQSALSSPIAWSLLKNAKNRTHRRVT